MPADADLACVASHDRKRCYPEWRNRPATRPLDYSVTDRVAYATLCLPETGNAVTEQTLDDINDVVARVQHDATGARGWSSAAGVTPSPPAWDADMLATLYSDIEFYEHILTRVAALGLSLEALDVPVIAAVNGTATEVGFDLALACDLIVNRRRGVDRRWAIDVRPRAWGWRDGPAAAGRRCDARPRDPLLRPHADRTEAAALGLRSAACRPRSSTAPSRS